ncbi:glycosyltransferase [Roseivirga sp. E12]|uniref:glycosyltransferase n=1 Tax=Roseivirga sp. E12 TaxID=2819237 RepID=UPI001ABC7D90|nr:glycosyltransferase [Roseivirga sp. E12]MBO3699750.1 glycosyltransferase [Roseivirga sp. E12]
MKVFLIIDSLGSGGAQRQMINLASGFANRGIDIKLISLHKLNVYQETLKNYNLESVRTVHSQNSLKKLLKLGLIIRKERPTHAIVFLFNPSLYTLLAALVFPKMKVILSERTYEECVPKFHRQITRRLYWRASFVAANSWRQTDILNRLGHKNAICIPNGVHSEMLSKKKNFENSRIIVSVGRVSKLKNPMLLFAALERVNKIVKIPYRVLWLGDYTEHIGFYNECNELWESSAAREFWTWVGRTEDVSSFLNRAYFLYHGSFGEGSPNAVFEALAQGLPVLASDIFDHGRVVMNGKNGFLFDPSNVDDLVRCIQNMDNLSEKEYQNMTLSAYNTVAENYTHERFTGAYLQLVRDSSK